MRHSTRVFATCVWCAAIACAYWPGEGRAQTDLVFSSSFECTPSYRDVDGDGFGDAADSVLQCPPPAGYVFDSRDCADDDPAVNPGQTDVPDVQFRDVNCDLIDGDAAGAVFVDTVAGLDANDGTMQFPKKTIQAAIGDAAMSGRDVYVSAGTYGEAVALASGVGVFGGYLAADDWSRSASNLTRIDSPQPTGVTALGLAAPTEIQLLRIDALSASGVDGTGDGNSSVAVRVVSSSGGLTIRNCHLVAGNGSDGANVGNGATGVDGGQGGPASGITRGTAGTSVCGAPGGDGAPGVSGVTGGLTGNTGTTAVGGGTGGMGGSGGSSGSCSGTSSSNGGPAPPFSTAAGAGNAGGGGAVGLPFGTIEAGGSYRPATGGAGEIGRTGGGGGGGGSGGGSANGNTPAPFDFCTSCNSISSGAGGGGGGGGCGGGSGPGGRGGGGSFGIAIAASNVAVFDTQIATGTGGNGGPGGNGGIQGGGGPPGAGAGGAVRSNACSTRSGGDGAAGQQGGTGGRGGGGAGGTGGASVCVAYAGTAPSITGLSCTNTGAGAGGAGGSNGTQQAPTGAAGVTGDVRASN